MEEKVHQPKPASGSETAVGGRRFSLRRLLPLVVVVAGLGAFFAFGFDRYLSCQSLSLHREEAVTWCTTNPVLAAFGYVGAYALLVALSVPGAVWLTIAGGLVFGPYWATLYVVIGATLGACAIFLVARYALADLCRAKAGSAIARMEDGFRRNATSYMLFLRLVPVFPFWLVNLVPALVGVPLGTFAIATLFGIIPGAFVYALVGDGVAALFDAGTCPDIGVIFQPRVLVPMMGLALLSLVPVAYRTVRKARTGAAGGGEGNG
jgi:uncharacterized membrane protein YdjX (TVP38/TMEM64 family)